MKDICGAAGKAVLLLILRGETYLEEHFLSVPGAPDVYNQTGQLLWGSTIGTRQVA